MPMAFICAWNSVSVWARMLLPEVDWMVKVRSWPFWGPDVGWK